MTWIKKTITYSVLKKECGWEIESPLKKSVQCIQKYSDLKKKEFEINNLFFSKFSYNHVKSLKKKYF